MTRPQYMGFALVKKSACTIHSDVIFLSKKYDYVSLKKWVKKRRKKNYNNLAILLAPDFYTLFQINNLVASGSQAAV